MQAPTEFLGDSTVMRNHGAEQEGTEHGMDPDGMRDQGRTKDRHKQHGCGSAIKAAWFETWRPEGEECGRGDDETTGEEGRRGSPP